MVAAVNVFAPVTREKLFENVESHCRFVEACLKDGTSESWTPTLMLFQPPTRAGDKWTASVFSLQVPFTTPAEKDRAFRRIVGDVVAQKFFPAIALLSSEAWTADRRPDLPGQNLDSVPGHRETLLVMGATCDGLHQTVAVAELNRTNGLIQPPRFQPPVEQPFHCGLLAMFYRELISQVGLPKELQEAWEQ